MPVEAGVAMLRRLAGRDFNGYLARRLPHDLDTVADGVVLAYREASPLNQQAFLDNMGRNAASVLSVYGQRKAVMAVREQSRDDLRMGLIGMGMAQARLEDYRDNLIVLAAVNHSAAMLGSGLDALIDDVRDVIPDAARASFRAFAGRSVRDKSLQSMGLAVRGSGEDFIYVSGPTS